MVPDSIINNIPPFSSSNLRSWYQNKTHIFSISLRNLKTETFSFLNKTTIVPSPFTSYQKKIHVIMEHKLFSCVLCWFQTSLPLAALLLRHMITACCFMVYNSQWPRRFGLSPSCIALELN